MGWGDVPAAPDRHESGSTHGTKSDRTGGRCIFGSGVGGDGPARGGRPPVAPDDVAVTDDGAYTRHDGGTDRAIPHCSNSGAIRRDAGCRRRRRRPERRRQRRQGNEPAVAIDPTNPDLVVAGWNDYCMTDLAAGWQGLGYSTDRARTWTDSVVPGYPADTSAEGMASPLFGTHTDAGDPLVAFDNAGRLFVGGIAFNRAKPQNGDVWVGVPTAAEPHPTGYPEGLPAHGDRRAGDAGHRRHLPGQADARGRPHRRARMTATSTCAGRGSSATPADEDLLQPIHRPRRDVLQADRYPREVGAGLRHRRRARRRRLRHLAHVRRLGDGATRTAWRSPGRPTAA